MCQESSQEKKSVAFIGLGQIATYHLDAIASNEQLRLEAVYDTNAILFKEYKILRRYQKVIIRHKQHFRGRAQMVPHAMEIEGRLRKMESIESENSNSEFHIKRCKSEEELKAAAKAKKDNKFDYAIVATPPDVHVQSIKLAREIAHTVLVEKPIVPASELNFEQDNAQLKDLNAYVIYHWQYETELLQLKERLDELKGETIQKISVHIRDPYLRHRLFPKIRSRYCSKGDAWTDSGVNALSVVAMFIRLDNPQDVHLYHRKRALSVKKAGHVPICSEFDFTTGDTRVYIKVEWGGPKDEKKETVIETEKHVFRVDHCAHKVTENGQVLQWKDAEAKHPVHLQINSRLDDQYTRFYTEGLNEVQDDDVRTKNREQTLQIQRLLDFPATSPLTFREKRMQKRSHREKTIDAEEATYQWAVFGLICFGILLAVAFYVQSNQGQETTQNYLETLTDILINMLSSLFGVVASFLIYRTVKRNVRKHEDELKVEENDEKLKRQYHDGRYLQCFVYKEMPVSVLYAPFYDCTQNGELRVKDSQEKFELDNFIRFQYFSIRSAHERGSFNNETTIRLRDVDTHTQGEDVVIMTQRANYLAHMLTNRAIDYHINGMASLRQLFEYKSELTPLNESKFANHIGINGLIFIGTEQTGRYILLPQRGGKATIAKGKLTASVATRLKMKNYAESLKDEDVQTLDENLLRQSMAIRKEDCQWEKWFPMGKSEKEKYGYTNKLMGGGRDIYEGGKPTLFYLVELPGLSLDEYMKLPYEHQTGVDEVARIFVIPEKELKIRDNLIEFTGAKVKGAYEKYFSDKDTKAIENQKISRYQMKLEKNLLSLFYHYSKYLEKNKSAE